MEKNLDNNKKLKKIIKSPNCIHQPVNLGWSREISLDGNDSVTENENDNEDEDIANEDDDEGDDEIVEGSCDDDIDENQSEVSKNDENELSNNSINNKTLLINKKLDEFSYRELTSDVTSSVSFLNRRITRQYASEFVLPDETRIAIQRCELIYPIDNIEQVILSISTGLSDLQDPNAKNNEPSNTNQSNLKSNPNSLESDFVDVSYSLTFLFKIKINCIKFI